MDHYRIRFRSRYPPSLSRYTAMRQKELEGQHVPSHSMGNRRRAAVGASSGASAARYPGGAESAAPLPLDPAPPSTSNLAAVAAAREKKLMGMLRQQKVGGL